MDESAKKQMEAEAYRQMAVLRFSSMVLFSALIKTQLKNRTKDDLREFMNLAHEYIALLEANTGNDPVMRSLVPSIEAFVDDIIVSVGVSLR